MWHACVCVCLEYDPFIYYYKTDKKKVCRACKRFDIPLVELENIFTLSMMMYKSLMTTFFLKLKSLSLNYSIKFNTTFQRTIKKKYHM